MVLLHEAVGMASHFVTLTHRLLLLLLVMMHHLHLVLLLSVQLLDLARMMPVVQHGRLVVRQGHSS